MKFGGGRIRCFDAISAKRSVETLVPGHTEGVAATVGRFRGAWRYPVQAVVRFSTLTRTRWRTGVERPRVGKLKLKGVRFGSQRPSSTSRYPWTNRPWELSSGRNYHACQVVLPRPSLPVPRSNEKKGSMLRDCGYYITDATPRGTPSDWRARVRDYDAGDREKTGQMVGRRTTVSSCHEADTTPIPYRRVAMMVRLGGK